ncbi:MAG TPA: GNAT family N-acetyltransferase [Nocardioidaceae bacterium]|nr:GNAT family N-acetyltransferase [Nocardioidaceae bacterium]
MLKPVAFDRRPSTTLSDVTTRYAELADVDEVQAMHDRCSESSLYRRFHAPLPRVSTRLVRQLVAPGGGWSVVAETGGRVVALACVAPVSPSEVEVGLLVEDQHQHRGIGSRMLHEIAVDAASRGFRAIELHAQPENDRVLATVQKAGLIGRVSWDDSLLRISMSLHRVASTRVPQPA